MIFNNNYWLKTYLRVIRIYNNRNTRNRSSNKESGNILFNAFQYIQNIATIFIYIYDAICFQSKQFEKLKNCLHKIFGNSISDITINSLKTFSFRAMPCMWCMDFCVYYTEF